jgi:hypothetical protein
VKGKSKGETVPKTKAIEAYENIQIANNFGAPRSVNHELIKQ